MHESLQPEAQLPPVPSATPLVSALASPPIAQASTGVYQKSDEAVWAGRAKRVIDSSNEPYHVAREFGELKAAYIEGRYGKQMKHIVEQQ